MNPKISIITVCFNSEETIRESIESVISQDYSNIEYIVVDGGSTDGTLSILNSYKKDINILISEKDDGLYDALNKGIKVSDGEIIGMLHSDDVFSHNKVLSKVSDSMTSNSSEVCFSNVAFIDKVTNKIIRYYSSKSFNTLLLRTGWMPPHTATFMNKSIFRKYGYYSLNYKIASDFDFFIRIFKTKDTSWSYLDDLTVIMKAGGLSNSGYKSKLLIIKEIRESLKSNGLRPLIALQIIRYFIRLSELVIRPKLKSHE